MKRIIALMLSLLLVVSVFSCGKKEEKKDNSFDKAESTTVTTEEPIETEEQPEAEPQYNWAIEPGEVIGDVQPVYDMMTDSMVSMGVSYLKDDRGIHLIDFDGEIKCTLDQEGYSYCSYCGYITDHMYIVDPESYELRPEALGHGGYTNEYIYDAETQTMYLSDFGGFYEVEENIEYAIVTLGQRRVLTSEEQEFFGTDFIYDSKGKYGIVVDSKLTVPCEYDMYIPFDKSGITALCKDGKWGYFNKSGEQILPCEYQPSARENQNLMYEGVYSPYQSSYGYIAVKKDDKWGYVNLKGETVVDFIFDEARPVFKDKAWVMTEDGWGVIELPDLVGDMTRQDAEQQLAELEGVFSYIGKRNVYSTPVQAFSCDGVFIYYIADDGTVLTENM